MINFHKKMDCTDVIWALVIVAVIWAGFFADPVFAQPDNALNFDGTDDYVNLGNVLGFGGTASYTFEAWVNPRLVGNGGTIIGKYRDSYVSTYKFHVNT
ncbi:MAG: LamG domain-containing protein [Desulfobacteraceae bacterium]|nr:LamG domain-containing protein [Desulfobacteraceae bacterium]